MRSFGAFSPDHTSTEQAATLTLLTAVMLAGQRSHNTHLAGDPPRLVPRCSNPLCHPLRALLRVEDEDSEHQDPLSHPLHCFLLAHRSCRFRRIRVGKRELEEKGAGAEAERAEEEVRLHRG